MDVWYPSDAGTSSGSPASLDLLVADIALPGVRRDADVATGQRFPLVVFSGSGGVRFQSWFLLRASPPMVTSSWPRIMRGNRRSTC